MDLRRELEMPCLCSGRERRVMNRDSSSDCSASGLVADEDAVAAAEVELGSARLRLVAVVEGVLIFRLAGGILLIGLLMGYVVFLSLKRGSSNISNVSNRL